MMNESVATETSGLLNNSMDDQRVRHPHSIAESSDLEEALDKGFPTATPCLGRLSPLFILVFLVLCQMVNYFDRGAVAALVKPLGSEFDLSKFEQGLIGGSFMLGYMLFAPMAGYLSSRIRGTRIMACGLVLWIAAAAVAAISWHFYPLIATRLLLGFGEATFASIAPSIIDDISIPRTRSLWLAMYFMAIPVGQALGFIAAGTISTAWSWRVVFIVEAVLMVPFPIICFFLPHISVIVENGFRKLAHADRKEVEEERLRTNEQAQMATHRTFLESLRIILSLPVYVCTMLGYSCLTYTLGGMSFWAGPFFTESLFLPLSLVTQAFGGVSAAAGILGAASGGVILDKLGGTSGTHGLSRALGIALVSAVAGTILGVACVLTSNPGAAFALAAGAITFYCMAFSPVNGVILRVVPVDLRAFAISVNLFTIHLLGDFPSPVITGWIADALVSDDCTQFCSLQASMILMMAWCTMAVVCWGIGFLFAYSAGAKK